MLSLGLSLWSSTILGRGGAAFSPLSLFASGEEGAWYEPSTTTAFKSTGDLTPCGYGDGCGFLLDKSKGAGYAGGSFTGLGSELVTNGTFNTDVSGWIGVSPSPVLSVVSGRLRVTGVGGGTQAYTVIPTTAGKVYKIDYEGFDGTGNFQLKVGTAAASSDIFSTNTDSGSRIFVSLSANTYITLRNVDATAGSYIEADNISVRELPGHHATQVTAGARPTLARVPPRGRVNELSETDTLATQSVTVTAAQRTLSFTGTGTVTLTGASTAGPLVGTGAGDRVSLTFTPSAGSLTLTVSGTVTDAQLELGSAATNYQFVADLLGFDVTEAGVTSLDYLAFNADDGMATASIDFTATDKMSVFAGVEKESDAALGQLVELSATVVSNSGSFSMPSAVSGGSWTVGVKGTGTFANATATGLAAPITTVNTGLFDLSLATGDGKLRVDGTLVATTATDTGGGTFGNYPLNIGARDNAASVWFDGKLFGLIVRGASSTAQEISNTETYLANRSGVVL